MINSLFFSSLIILWSNVRADEIGNVHQHRDLRLSETCFFLCFCLEGLGDKRAIGFGDGAGGVLKE